MSTLSVGTIKSASSAAPVFQNSSGTEKGQLAKVWVNFDGSGSERDDFNVSSVTDNGTGDYTVNFSNAMANANYSAVGMAMRDSTNTLTLLIRGDSTYGNSFTTGSVRLNTRENSNSLVDCKAACLAIFGD